MDTRRPPRNDDPSLREAVRLGHEPKDVSVKGLFVFAGALLATLVLVLFGLGFVFRGTQAVSRQLEARDARSEAGAESLVHLRPDYSGPLLQVRPEEDLREMRARTTAELESYGWVDKEAGIVRLPIDRAMELLAQRGLPPISPGLTMEALQRQRAQPQVYGQALRP